MSHSKTLSSKDKGCWYAPPEPPPRWAEIVMDTVGDSLLRRISFSCPLRFSHSQGVSPQLVASSLPSAEKAAVYPPLKVALSSLLCGSHRRTAPSALVVASVWPLGEKATESTR